MTAAGRKTIARRRVAQGAVVAYVLLLTYLLLAPHPLWCLGVAGRTIERTVDLTLAGCLQHAAAYALLGASLAWVCGRASAAWQWGWLLLAMGHGVAMEWLQRFFPHRFSGWPDALANVSGVAFGALAGLLILRHRSRAERKSAS
jgi:VanZ family protein